MVEQISNPGSGGTQAAAAGGSCSSSNHWGAEQQAAAPELNEVQAQLAALLPRLHKLMGHDT